MVNMEWREILSFSQKELEQADKENLCENLSWMDSDDIEISFTGLKILFRLAQDILKFKNEQVNDLLGQMDKISKSRSTSKATKSYKEQSTKDIIKSDKKIIEQLQLDIAKLEEQKNRLQKNIDNADKESDSSRATLSEIEAIAQLEKEITLKNKHMRKLLNDIKILEEVNSMLKEKVLLLKEKLLEATKLINNLTEQIHAVTNEHVQLKEALAESEQTKSELTIEIESLRTELLKEKTTTQSLIKDVKSKVQHWKNLARSKTDELVTLSAENEKLKKDIINLSGRSQTVEHPNTTNEADMKIKELQDKLSEASKEIEQSANVIYILRDDNFRLKNILDEVPDSSSDIKNVSDDGKEQAIINKLKKKIVRLTTSLQGADEMIATREKELAELTTQLQLCHSNENETSLLIDAKKNKHQLKLKDERIKSFIQEINDLNQQLDNLQLENETLRQRYNIPVDENIPIQRVQEKYRNLERNNKSMSKEIRNQEDNIISLELENRTTKTKLSKMLIMLRKLGYSNEEIDISIEDHVNGLNNIKDGQCPSKYVRIDGDDNEVETLKNKMQLIIDENEGLRKGLQEISDVLKDNSKTSSGLLTLQCPSLEAVLQCMEARHMAGWFAPHMTAAMELRTALGGKDALLTALHQARKETYDAIDKLGRESKKSLELQRKLEETENKFKQENLSIENFHYGEFGNWISDREMENIDINDDIQIKNLSVKANTFFEKSLIKGLEYFHIKFKALYDKLVLLVIEAADNQNDWSMKEEQYKAKLENIEKPEENDDDSCDISPGIVTFPKNSVLERKCTYLEDTYKYIRTMNENMKNENLELRKEIVLISSEHEMQIQNLIFSIISLANKLRSSVNLDVFWKQNKVLNEVNMKYRKALEENMSRQKNINELQTCTTASSIEIRNDFQSQLYENDKLSSDDKNKLLDILSQSNIESVVQRACYEILENRNKQIYNLEEKNSQLQEIQSQIIDESLASLTKQEVNLMKDQLETLKTENKIIKEQYQQATSHLEIALLQLKDIEHQHMHNNEEVNLLRHQIIDLQASGDNKAVIARLSNEVLVARLQASEYQDKIEKIILRLNKEKELRAEAECMLNSRQKIFEVYNDRYQSKFKYIYDVIHILRQQYQGGLPLINIENHINKLEDLSRKSHAVNEQLTEIEDLRSSLMIKHAVYDQVLDVSKNKCLADDGGCSHKLQYIVTHKTHLREIEYLNKKLEEADHARKELIIQCNNLEQHLILLKQASRNNPNYLKENINELKSDDLITIHGEDLQSSEEKSRRSETITLSNPKILKPDLRDVVIKTGGKQINLPKDITLYTSVGTQTCKNNIPVSHVMIQTTTIKLKTNNKSLQTENDTLLYNLKSCIEDLKKDNEIKCNDLSKALSVIDKKSEEILALNSQKNTLESKCQGLYENNNEKDNLIHQLRISIDDLKKEINDVTIAQMKTKSKQQDIVNEESKSLLQALKQFEIDKSTITTEYEELLNNERDEYYKSIQELQVKILELQTKLDRRGSDSNATNTETLKDVVNKYTMKITELEEKCFKLQSELDECKSELTTYQSETDRWKDLATERLSKMEQLNCQLEERHCHEVDSYKAENQHWLSQLSESQKEHMELRSRLTEQKALYMKQLAEKDVHIEQLRTVVHNLKTQVINMQTMLSINDPSFDLSAIVEVDESSDILSQNGSDRLELKYESTVDINEDDTLKIPGSSTSIWQETIIERLRREKQLAGKQNTILRRQIKALAARERRARLDAQNLKNQIFRISTSGSKVATAESAALQNKIASLQVQLTNARRDTQSNVTLWDKWKRAQQAAERWQTRYEEKCQELKKIEANLNLAKASVIRLEREKRVLLSRISDIKDESRLAIEKQDEEPQEKTHRSITDTNISLERDDISVPFVSTHALLQRVNAQQHRIAALEIAEKGNEHLVSEYEKRLAEITSLKGQVLKLESTLLESQIRTPINKSDNSKPELDYWKGYCEMLKEENVQLNLKINSMETAPTTAHQHRVNDLEQTVLTLRGLVTKLQAEQKSSGGYKRPDSIQRPNSGRSGTDKNRTQLESCRIEIVNLKRSIQDKDLLLEKSKEMLKIAAEREDELLRENAYLRRRIYELTKPNKGFLSA